MKIIKIEQPDCNPCNMVQNFLDGQNIEHEKINVFDNPEVASGYGIMSVPVTILLDAEGNEIKRSTGYKPAELEEIIKEFKGE